MVLVVDFTAAFVDSAYPTGFSPTGWPAVEATVRLLASARTAGVPIVYTKSFDHTSTERRPESAWTSSLRFVREGDHIVDQLCPTGRDRVIAKGDVPSAFFATGLADVLRDLGRDTVVIAGMTTSGCVRATVVDAFQHGFSVVIPQECVADRSQVSHQVSLFDMHVKYAHVGTLSDVIRYLESPVR